MPLLWKFSYTKKQQAQASGPSVTLPCLGVARKGAVNPDPFCCPSRDREGVCRSVQAGTEDREGCGSHFCHAATPSTPTQYKLSAPRESLLPGQGGSHPDLQTTLGALPAPNSSPPSNTVLQHTKQQVDISVSQAEVSRVPGRAWLSRNNSNLQSKQKSGARALREQKRTHCGLYPAIYPEDVTETSHGEFLMSGGHTIHHSQPGVSWMGKWEGYMEDPGLPPSLAWVPTDPGAVLCSPWW